jgi:hypothetical protein
MSTNSSVNTHLSLHYTCTFCKQLLYDDTLCLKAGSFLRYGRDNMSLAKMLHVSSR